MKKYVYALLLCWQRYVFYVPALIYLHQVPLKP